MDLLIFPACTHQKKRVMAPVGRMRLWAAEPFRIFFLLGSLWAIIGVFLWPLFFQGKLSYYPNVAHAHLMIQGFAGAFVIGFLGTAGPRMASVPKFSVRELFLLITLHSSAAILHGFNQPRMADGMFVLTLLVFVWCLASRIIHKRKGDLPPQLFLSLSGIACAIIGSLMLVFPSWQATMPIYHLARLLLFQGFLLLPILGIGSFLFPRMLGGDFGDAGNSDAKRRKKNRCIAAGILIIVSFLIEAWDFTKTGAVLRVLTMVVFFAQEIRWKKSADLAKRGTLATGLFLALLAMISGLLVAAWLETKRIPVMHLLYVSGFGMLIFVVASRVLFGHSGELAGFSRRSWWVRFLLFLFLLAAATRATADFLPEIMITHYQYAAWTWIVAVILWVIWHGRRWDKHEDE